MTKRTKDKPAEERLAGLFEDLVMGDGDAGIVSFCRHAGIDLRDVPAAQWWPAFRGFYVSRGAVDENRVAADLATWPPIASRVIELQLAARAD